MATKPHPFVVETCARTSNSFVEMGLQYNHFVQMRTKKYNSSMKHEELLFNAQRGTDILFYFPLIGQRKQVPFLLKRAEESIPCY